MRLRGLNGWLILGGVFSLISVIILCRKKQILNKDKQIFKAAVLAGFAPETAKIVVAQARHETGNYASFICLKNNNYFGMRPANIRQTTRKKGGIYEGANYAVYEDLEGSVLDLKKWFDFNRISTTIKDPEKYVSQIKKKGYFEDSEENYLSGVLAALERIKL